MITVAQMRAARALIDWSQKDLADRSGVALATIRRMESVGPEKSAAGTVDAVERSLVAGGVQFIPENGGGAGVRLAKPEGGTT